MHMQADILETWLDAAGQICSKVESVKKEQRKINFNQLLGEIQVM